MFESLSVDCKLELASCLEQTYCEPDCFIIEYGEKGNEMYFIMHGFADVIIPAQNEMGEPDPNISYGTVVATVKRGDFFGEVCTTLIISSSLASAFFFLSSYLFL